MLVLLLYYQCYDCINSKLTKKFFLKIYSVSLNKNYINFATIKIK